uniref:Methionine aminopeptidase 1A n=1 Tax=Arundo donax TaxID=35708 RepID=A0A0A9E6A4_ARUDO
MQKILITELFLTHIETELNLGTIGDQHAIRKLEHGLCTSKSIFC